MWDAETQTVSGGTDYLQHTKVGSVMYAAPEVLVSTAASGYDAACADIWSLGMIFHELVFGRLASPLRESFPRRLHEAMEKAGLLRDYDIALEAFFAGFLAMAFLGADLAALRAGFLATAFL